MHLQAISGWRWLERGALLGAAVVSTLAAEGPAAKGKVTFSDTKDGGVRVDVGLPPQMFQRGLDFPRRGSSSLDSVGAVPFAPLPGISPGVMSRRERESRDARNNWILDSGKELAISEENANRAFGVRTDQFELNDNEPDRPTSFWKAYFKKNSDHTARPAPVLETPHKDRPGDDPLRRFDSPGGTEFGSALSPSANREMNRVFFSDTTSRTPIAGTLADALEGTKRDLVRDSLNFNAVSFFAKPDTRATARAEQFRRMLGTEPLGRPNPTTPLVPDTSALAETGAGRNPLGSMDLIGVTPDPTRKELHPVVARPTPEFGGGARLSFSDSISGLGPQTVAPRRSLIDMAPVRSLQPLATSAETSLGNAAPRITYSPTTLEIPRRSF